MSVADKVGIEVEAVNFAAEYRERVFASFLAEYRAGRTPNPDVLCNAEIKFKAFLDHAVAMGAERIATGHYARVDANATGALPCCSRARTRARTSRYFLHRLSQAQLSRSVFPVGDLRKTEVRASRARRACRTTPRRTRRASASSASARSASSCRATCRASRGRS